ncbi:MAG: NUDIX domain-containing protein, partial [Nanobdellota archaeon]
MDLTQNELQDLVGAELTFGYKGDLLLATRQNNVNLLEESTGKAKKPYEYFQVFDQNDQPIVVDGLEVVCYRKECHGDDRIQNLYHRGANAFIVNSRNEILVPIRAPDKDLFPSMGDVSVSEHVNVRESYFDAVLRGFREEQGTTINPWQLEFIVKKPVTESPEQMEMCEYYVFYDQGEQYTISDETASQRWVPIYSILEGRVDLNYRPDH